MYMIAVSNDRRDSLTDGREGTVRGRSGEDEGRKGVREERERRKGGTVEIENVCVSRE